MSPAIDSSGTMKAPDPLTIGAAEIGNWGKPLDTSRAAIRTFVGCMDDLLVWNRSLSSEEIKDLYSQTHP